MYSLAKLIIFCGNSQAQSIFRISLMKNPFLFISMIAAFFALMAVIYVPALERVFRTVPLTVNEWGQIMLVTVTVVAAVERDTWIRRRDDKEYRNAWK